MPNLTPLRLMLELELKSLLVRVGGVGGGWVVDKTKIMQFHLLTEVEVEDEFGNILRNV